MAIETAPAMLIADDISSLTLGLATMKAVNHTEVKAE